MAYHFRPNPARHCYFAFPEDYSTSELQYKRGELRRRARKPVFELCFIYRADEGVLELSAPGSRKDAEQLQEAFCRTALGLHRMPAPATPNAFELNELKQRSFSFPTDPADEVESVELVAMRINEVGDRGRRLLFEQGRGDGASLHDWIEQTLNTAELPLTMIDVNQIRLRMTFRGDPRLRRRPTLTFTVTPDSVSLRDEPRHLVAKRCLRRWDIAL